MFITTTIIAFFLCFLTHVSCFEHSTHIEANQGKEFARENLTGLELPECSQKVLKLTLFMLCFVITIFLKFLMPSELCILFKFNIYGLFYLLIFLVFVYYICNYFGKKKEMYDTACQCQARVRE